MTAWLSGGVELGLASEVSIKHAANGRRTQVCPELRERIREPRIRSPSLVLPRGGDTQPPDAALVDGIGPVRTAFHAMYPWHNPV
jgi:hypothetical protein